MNAASCSELLKYAGLGSGEDSVPISDASKFDISSYRYVGSISICRIIVSATTISIFRYAQFLISKADIFH